MIRQQFLHTPAMIRDPGGHGRCPRQQRCRHPLWQGETRMRRTKIVDSANQIHAMLQGQHTARQRPAAARQRCQALAEGRVAAAQCMRY